MCRLHLNAVAFLGSTETLRDTMNVSNLLPLATPVVDSSEKPSHHKLGQNPNSSSGSSRNTQQQLLAAAQMPQNAISSSLAAAAAGGASSGQGGGQFASLPQYQLPNYPPAFGSSKYSQLLAIMEEMGKDIRPG